MSDWVYACKLLKAAPTVDQLGRMLIDDGAQIEPEEGTDGVHRRVGAAIASAPLEVFQSGAVLLGYTMGRSHSWRLFGLLDRPKGEGEDIALLQKAAGNQGPYVLGEHVTRQVGAVVRGAARQHGQEERQLDEWMSWLDRYAAAPARRLA